MVIAFSWCVGFKKSCKSPCKKCKRRCSGHKEPGIKSFYQKAKKLAEKAVNSDIAKITISEGLACATKTLRYGYLKNWK